MEVTIEEFRKAYGDVHFYVVDDKMGNSKLFSYMDDAPEGDIYNKALALSKAKKYALQLKEGKKDTITLIETL